MSPASKAAVKYIPAPSTLFPTITFLITRGIQQTIIFWTANITIMQGYNMKELPLNELLKLLAVSQRNFALSRLYRQGADTIEQNKRQLEKIQKAISDKQEDSIQNQ